MNDSIISIDSVLHQAHILVAGASQNPNEEPDYPLIFLTVICVMVVVGSGVYLQFGNTNSWRKGIFPKRLKYTPQNLFEAYISLGLQLFKRDDEHIRENASYMASYLNSRFPDVINYSYYEHCIDMIQYQVSEKSVLDWLHERMPKEERPQIIDFLVDLAFFNELLTRGELIMIYRVAGALGITREEVDSIVAIRHNKAEEKRKSHQYLGKSLKEHSFDILGLAPDVDFETVKARYRELVKRFHPDLFSHMGQNEMEMAHDRFVAINAAYQYLELYYN